jgi:hypothetical protein
MGGSDESSNLVDLTPEEHFLCHILLVKIYPLHTGLIYAVYAMTRGHKGKRTKRKIYGWLRRKYSAQRKLDSTGTSNTQFGTMWINKLGSLENKKIVSGAAIPDGWVKGRKLSFEKTTGICVKCNSITPTKKSKLCDVHKSLSLKDPNAIFLTFQLQISDIITPQINTPK